MAQFQAQGKKEIPRNIALSIVSHVPTGKDSDMIEKVEVAGPGFVNIFVKDSFVADNMQTLLKGK